MEVLELFSGGPNEHVAHEQCMVGAGADNANVDSVPLIPARVPIDDIYAISCVQIVDSALAIDSPDLSKNKSQLACLILCRNMSL